MNTTLKSLALPPRAQYIVRASWLAMLASLLIFSSCENKEVAETAAVVAVVATAVSIGAIVGDEEDSSHSHDDEDDDEPRRHQPQRDRYFQCRDRDICTSYTDYSGRHRESCGVVHVCRTSRDTHIHEGYPEHSHNTYSSHYHPRRRVLFHSHNSPLTDPQLVGQALEGRSITELIAPHHFARAHGMSILTAQQVLQGLDEARGGDFSTLAAIGLSESVLLDLARGTLPSAPQLDEMARQLDQHPAATLAMMTVMMDVFTQHKLSYL